MKILETIKTVLFIGLFVSAVAMAGVYIAAQPRADAAGDLPDEVLSALRGGTGNTVVRLEEAQLLPAFLGIKQAGQSAVGLMDNAAMLSDLSEALSPWLAFALGEGSRAETLPAADGDVFWQDCLAADAYFYLNWRFAVPAALLRAHSQPGRSSAMLETASGTLPRIAEIFFFPNGLADRVCAVSRDGEGRVTLWHRLPREDDALPGLADFAVYLERGLLQRYSFAESLGLRLHGCLSSLPVPKEPLSLPTLVRSHPYAAAAEHERVTDALLDLFAYNPNKVSNYYEADTDTAVFVETHGTLRAAGESLIYEASAQGGIAVADILRKSDASLTLRDDIMACEALVEALKRIAPDTFGGDADLRFSMIGTANDTLILTYAYTYDNIAIAADVPAIRLTVRGHRIIGAEIAVCCYRATDTTTRAGSQMWMLNLAEYLGTDCTISLRYAVDTDGTTLRADWTLQ